MARPPGSKPRKPTLSPTEPEGDWQQRALERSLNSARLRALARSSQFLAAAMELLEETGNLDFTVQNVVARSSLSLRAFYQHFAGKDELLVSLFEELVTQFSEDLAEVVSKVDDPFDRLETYIREFISRAHASQPFGGRTLTMYQMRLAAERPDDYGKAVAQQVQFLQSVIRHGVERGAFRTDIPEMAMTLLINATLVSMAQMDVFEIRSSDGPISADQMWLWCRSAVSPGGTGNAGDNGGVRKATPAAKRTRRKP